MQYQASSRARRLSRRRALGTGAVCAVSTLVFGTGVSALAPASSPDGGPVAGGEITMLVHNEGGSSMDPATALVHSTTSSTSRVAVFDLLVFIDPESGAVETQLAESLEPNDDGSVWTMTLRADVEFSDGTPFNAEAVAAEVARLADPDTMAAAQTAAQSVTVNVIDDLTVEFVPDVPNLAYGYEIALSFPYIPSPTAIAEDPEGFATAPVGAGPYVLVDWVVGETKRLERNPNYWQEGKPYVDAIETIVVNDTQQQINRLLAGDANLISNQTGEMFQLARDNGLEVQTGGQLSGGFVWNFNHESGPFADVRARQAFQLAVDSAEMNELLFPAGGIETPVNLFSVDSPFYNADLDLPATNSDEAQALFDELAADNGGPLTFELTTRAGQPPLSYAEFAQAALSQYDNVEVSVRALEANEYLAAVRASEYSVAYYTGWWSAPYPVFHQIYETGGGLNYSNYSNADVDALFAEATQTTDADELFDIYSQITEIMRDDVAVIPFQVAEVGFIHAGNVHGLRGVHLGNTPLWEDVYLTDA